MVVGANGYAKFANVDLLVATGVDEQTAGAGHVLPLGFKFAILVKDLDALVLTVSHINPAVLVGADVVGNVELALAGA